jgi:hypothetical protein
VYEEVMRKIKIAGISSTKQMNFYLFNDMVVLTSKSYVFSEQFDLRMLILKKRQKKRITPKSPHGVQKGGFILDLIGADIVPDSPCQTLTLYFYSEDQRNSLFSSIIDVQKSIDSDTSVFPVNKNISLPDSDSEENNQNGESSVSGSK